MNKLFRIVLLAAFGVVVSASGLIIFHEPGQVNAQSQGACGDSCATDTSCSADNFCHTLIEWGQKSNITNTFPAAIGNTGITGYSSVVLPDGTVYTYVTDNGQVYECSNNNNTLSGCSSLHSEHFQVGSLEVDGFPNTIVNFNAEVSTENGIKVITYHLVRYKEIYSKKINADTKTTIRAWYHNTDLSSLVENATSEWNNGVILGFDSGIAYEDGRKEQRLIVGNLESQSYMNNNVSRMLVRVNHQSDPNNPANFSWSMNGAAIPFKMAEETTTSSPDGVIYSYDQFYNPNTGVYNRVIIYAEPNNLGKSRVLLESAVKKSNATKECRPRINSGNESCETTLPNTGYLPAPILSSVNNNCSGTAKTFSFNYSRRSDCTNYEIQKSPVQSFEENVEHTFENDGVFSQTNLDKSQVAYFRARCSSISNNSLYSMPALWSETISSLACDSQSPSPTSGTTTWTTPANLTTTQQCTEKKVVVTWTMPSVEAARDFDIGTRSCKRNTPNQTDCTNPFLKGYDKSDTTYNATTQTITLTRSFEDFAAQGQFELGATYLMAVRVGKGSSSQHSDYSAFIPVKFSGPEGDYDNSCTVNVTDFNSIVTDLFSQINHVLTDHSALFLLNKLIRNFGASN